SHRRTRGTRLFEVSRVDRVHSLKQVHVGQIHVHRDRMFKSHPGFLQYQADVVEALFDLGFEVVGDFAALQVLTRLAGDIECAVSENSGAEWAACGEFLGMNHFLLGEQREREEEAECKSFHTHTAYHSSRWNRLIFWRPRTTFGSHH